jgi:hypothetical protein
MWCEDHRRNELLDTYPRSQELMKAIRDVDGFSWLKDVRPHGDVRRYPGIRWRTKEDRRKEEEAEETPIIAQDEVAEAERPKAYRRF